MAVICENMLQGALHFLYYPFAYENLDETELSKKGRFTANKNLDISDMVFIWIRPNKAPKEVTIKIVEKSVTKISQDFSVLKLLYFLPN